MNRKDLRKSLENDLLRLYGPILTGDALWRSLGYTSKEAFRQALSRGTVPVHIFSIQNRRGKFALAKDVAQFLTEQRFLTQSKEEDK